MGRGRERGKERGGKEGEGARRQRGRRRWGGGAGGIEGEREIESRTRLRGVEGKSVDEKTVNHILAVAGTRAGNLTSGFRKTERGAARTEPDWFISAFNASLSRFSSSTMMR